MKLENSFMDDGHSFAVSCVIHTSNLIVDLDMDCGRLDEGELSCLERFLDVL